MYTAVVLMICLSCPGCNYSDPNGVNDPPDHVRHELQNFAEDVGLHVLRCRDDILG